MQTPLVFFGSSRYVLPILEALRKQFLLSLVVTTEKNQTDAVPHFCKKNDITCVSLVSAKDASFEEKLKKTHASLAVLADFGIVVSQDIINIFPKGIINIHPSLLPKYRGATPVQTALARGEKVTGISIMLLVKKLDSGPILFQKEEVIQPHDTADTLYEKLFTHGAHVLPHVLSDYIHGKLIPQQQDETRATYTTILHKEDGYIDSTHPPKNFKHLIMAYYPWPGVWTKLSLYGKEKTVKFLPENMLQVEGKKPMTVKDFFNGYKEAEPILKKLQLL